MVLSGLGENVMLNKIILTTDGTRKCVKGDLVPKGGTIHTGVDVDCVPLYLQCLRGVWPIVGWQQQGLT